MLAVILISSSKDMMSSYIKAICTDNGTVTKVNTKLEGKSSRRLHVNFYILTERLQ